MTTTPATEAETATSTKTRDLRARRDDPVPANSCTADTARANSRGRSEDPDVGGRWARASKVVVGVGLWTLQTLLGLFFAGSGFGKVLMVDDRLYSEAPNAVAWYAAVPQPLIVFIGVCEVLGGLGVMLPSLSRIRTGLAPLAAAGLGLTMILAAAFHVSRSEVGLAALTLGLAAAASLLAIGRGRVRPLDRMPLTTWRSASTLAVLVAVVVFVFMPTWFVMARTRF